LVFNFETIDAHFLQAITLWINNLNRVISTKNYTYNELTAQLANHTAGFNVFHSVGQKDDFNVVFEFSCLKKNIGKAFSLLEEMISTPKFEKEHTLNAFKAFTNEATEGLI
jgi:Zn-dependent M16 (insulinase) family peptidase